MRRETEMEAQRQRIREKQDQQFTKFYSIGPLDKFSG